MLQGKLRKYKYEYFNPIFRIGIAAVNLELSFMVSKWRHSRSRWWPEKRAVGTDLKGMAITRVANNHQSKNRAHIVTSYSS